MKSHSAPSTPAFSIDEKAIRKLAALMTETGLTEIEVAEGDRRVRVGRTPVALATSPVQASLPAPAVVVPTSATVNAGGSAQGAEESLAKHPGAVASPMVGTVYLSPEPGAAPFAGEGMVVKAGDTVLTIEAMKVFNAIKAPIGGTVRRVLVRDKQPVEFGEVLLVIE